MIKTYLVPITEEVIKLMEKGEAPSFLHCATCLSGLTNGEVIQKMFPEAKVEINGFIVDVIFEMFEFHVEESWWNAKWGE